MILTYDKYIRVLNNIDVMYNKKTKKGNNTYSLEEIQRIILDHYTKGSDKIVLENINGTRMLFKIGTKYSPYRNRWVINYSPLINFLNTPRGNKRKMFDSFECILKD